MQQTYHFTKRVSAEGTITLDKLPPDTEVTIKVVSNSAFLDEWRKLQIAFQATSPLAKMNREEILQYLRKVREEVADELYPDTP